MKRLARRLGTFWIAAFSLAAHPGVAYAGELRALVRDQKGQPVQDAVVLAMPIDQRLIVAPKPIRNIVDQIDKEFVPRVKPVYVGSLVHFPNKDNVRHHVYSFSPAKKFDLALYAGTAAPPVLLDKPGLVVLGCNIHDWMIGYIYVADTPFFAKTESDGMAAIKELRAGEYFVRIWHPDLVGGEQETIKRITLGSEAVDVVWLLALKPAFRIPRQIGTHGSGYH
jgi:hypothetical protein